MNKRKTKKEKKKKAKLLIEDTKNSKISSKNYQQKPAQAVLSFYGPSLKTTPPGRFRWGVRRHGVVIPAKVGPPETREFVYECLKA